MSARDDVLAAAGKVVQAWRTERQFIPEAVEDAIIDMMRSIERMNSVPHARATDPATSKQGPQGLRMTQGRSAVLRCFKEHPMGTMTDAELVDRMQGVMTASGARSRRAELVRMGMLQSTKRTSRYAYIQGQRVRLSRPQTEWEAC